MRVIVDRFGDSNNFSVPLCEAIKTIHDGDTLIFSNKEYHFYKDFCPSKIIHMTNTDSFKNPKKYFAILLEHLKNVTVEGNGATFVIHGDICSLAVLNCTNIILKDFRIRYASPNNVEMKVVENKGRKVVFEIPESTLWYVKGRKIYFFEQSPFTKKNYWCFANDSNSYCGVCHSDSSVFRTLHPAGAFSWIKSIKRLSQTRVQISYYTKRNFREGDYLTYSQNKNRNTCGVFVNESSGVSAHNIEVNYLSGFGWLSQMCENISFDSVSFKADETHIVSAFADLIHVCGCKGDIHISNCDFAHPHDDAINIHGSFLRFKEKVSADTAVFEFVHKQQGGHRAFNEGDKVKFYYRNTLQELDGTYIVKSAVDDIDNKQVTVQFDKKLPDDIESKYLKQHNVVAENVTYCPNVEIHNCKFNAIPTRGILCTTSGRVKIHDNVFTNVAMANIFISNDAADWYESGPVRDVEIYSNKFYLSKSKQYEHANSPAILIKPITLGRVISKPIHKNIEIHSNYFKLDRDRAVTANGVENINVHDNEFDGTDEIKLNKCSR